MNETINTVAQKTGLPPGTLVYTGKEESKPAEITLIDYTHEFLEEKRIDSIDELTRYKESDSVTWISVVGLSDIDTIERLGEMFGIHPLFLEDVLSAHQRPKLEETDEYLYLVLKHISLENEPFVMSYEQINIFIFNNVVLTFRERSDDFFTTIRKHLEDPKRKLRNSGTDYLAYAIVDLIVDMNFPLLDSLDELCDVIEDELMETPKPKTLIKIQEAKKELITIRKSISPLREMLSALMRSDSALIHKDTHIYFRDIYDHAIHIIEEIESYRDILTGLLDIYISSVSNRLNEIMKVLTAFASIFIPITFLSSVYGMNFKYMPELEWQWGYPALWGIFILFSAVSLTYFKKKKWI